MLVGGGYVPLSNEAVLRDMVIDYETTKVNLRPHERWLERKLGGMLGSTLVLLA
jgi:hypothetical protein